MPRRTAGARGKVESSTAFPVDIDDDHGNDDDNHDDDDGDDDDDDNDDDNHDD